MVLQLPKLCSAMRGGSVAFYASRSQNDFNFLLKEEEKNLFAREAPLREKLQANMN